MGPRKSISALTDEGCKLLKFWKDDKQLTDLFTLNGGKTILGPWKMNVEVVDVAKYHEHPRALLNFLKSEELPLGTNHYMYAWCWSQNSDVQGALNGTKTIVDKPYFYEDEDSGKFFNLDEDVPPSWKCWNSWNWWN